jgi:hypothetical protein
MRNFSGFYLWDVTPCSLMIQRYRYLGGTYNLQGRQDWDADGRNPAIPIYCRIFPSDSMVSKAQPQTGLPIETYIILTRPALGEQLTYEGV